MDTVKEKRRSRGSLSKEEILRVALDIVQDEGADKLSMRYIAQKLQCSVASPYAHFENQEEILTSLIRIGEGRLADSLRDARDSKEDVFEQLHALAYAYLHFTRANKNLHKIMYNISDSPERKPIFLVIPASYRIFMRTILKGIKSQQISVSEQRCSFLARTMWTWMYGLSVLEMNNMSAGNIKKDPLAEGLEMFTTLLKNGY